MVARFSTTISESRALRRGFEGFDLKREKRTRPCYTSLFGAVPFRCLELALELQDTRIWLRKSCHMPRDTLDIHSCGRRSSGRMQLCLLASRSPGRFADHLRVFWSAL